MTEINKELAKIQQTLKAPKGQRNNFGNYNYRSCEDILNAVKPLLGEASLTIEDDIVMVGDRFYVKATATFALGAEAITTTAFARESSEKKGMDSAQITGATSSYARKYALNGLFAIDDTKDADTQDNSWTETKKAPAKPKPATPALPPVENVDDETFQKLCFLGSKLDLSKEQSKKLWDNIRTTHGWTRGRYNAETKKWQGTRMPAEAIRPIVEMFSKEAGQEANTLLADFGLDALSDNIYSEDLSQFSDEIF